MTLTDYLAARYQFSTGPAGARTLRRRSVESVGIFGKGKTTTADPWQTVKQALPTLLPQVREACGPCTKAQLVNAIHKVAEAHDLAELRERRNRAYTGGRTNEETTR